MAYVNFEYYKDTYCGGRTRVIAIESEFIYFEHLAEVFIKNATLGKSDTFEGNELKDCACAIAEQYKKFETEDKYNKGSALGISSEKVGEYSVSYSGGISAQELDAVKDKELKEIASKYLGITGLLYRGQ